MIFLDSQLPDGSGVDFMAYFVRVIRERKGRTVPVVSMSGNLVRDQEDLYLGYPIQDYLEKPISKSLFLNVLGAVKSAR